MGRFEDCTTIGFKFSWVVGEVEVGEVLGLTGVLTFTGVELVASFASALEGFMRKESKVEVAVKTAMRMRVKSFLSPLI